MSLCRVLSVAAYVDHPNGDLGILEIFYSNDLKGKCLFSVGHPQLFMFERFNGDKYEISSRLEIM